MSRRKPEKKPPSDGPWVAEFIESCCRQTEGAAAGELLRLRPWQRDIVDELFVLRPDGRRRYRQALLGLPRKNGKSALGAALALYLLMMDDEPGSQVYSCAGDRDQARIVFGTAKRMVELDPALRAELTLYRDTIVHKQSGSVYRVLSAEAYSKEGLNPSGVIFDELHVQPNRELWDVMTLGSGTRRQPLVLAITTAGFDVEGTICGERYQYGKKVASGEIDDPAFYFRWFEPQAADCDWRDPAVWAECNPALGDFLYEEFLEQQVKEKPENVFRRYFLNQWTATETGWIPYGAWDACQSDRALDPGLPLYVGIDIAHWVDSTAVALCQQQETPEGTRYVVRARIWENPYPEGHSLHDEWRMNNVEVQDHLRALHSAYPVAACAVDGEIFAGPMFSYDPWRFRKEAEELMGEGLAMTELPQTDQRMVPASQAFYEAIMQGEVAHDGDPALARHVANVTADQRPRGWRISKPKGSRRKIDAAVAAAIALHAARTTVAPGEGPRSAYEDHPLVVV